MATPGNLDPIREYATRYLKEQHELAEGDLVDILGERASWPAEKIQKLGYEVIWQIAPGAVLEQYRGIRRRGKWVRDLFPDWPFEPAPYIYSLRKDA